MLRFCKIGTVKLPSVCTVDSFAAVELVVVIQHSTLHDTGRSLQHFSGTRGVWLAFRCLLSFDRA